MSDYEIWELPIGTLEYYNEKHQYIFNGEVLPSITQLMKKKFGNKYNNISEEVLKKASENGTKMHEMIQNYEEKGQENDNLELHNYIFLKKHHNWEVKKCEVPIVLFKNDEPVACGRLDLLVEKDGKMGIFDIKRTSKFDREYVTYQTNLYRLAYQQTYNEKIELVGGIHLRNEVRKFYELPINEEVMELVEEK